MIVSVTMTVSALQTGVTRISGLFVCLREYQQGVELPEQLSNQQRAILVGVALSVVVAGFLSSFLGAAMWLLVLISVAAGWRYVPGFWRTILIGGLAGAVAGAVILGPGFRVAMRVVAVLSARPTRVPEFSIAGTMFIVIFVGVFLGAIFAVGAALVRRGLGLSGPVTAALMSVALIGLLLGDTGVRSEFVELGAGPWFNISMFGGVAFLYGLGTNKLIDRFTRSRARLQSREPVEVQG